MATATHASDVGSARSALHAIPPDLPREDWVRVVMAAQAAGFSREDVEEWSSAGASFDARSFGDVWRSCDPLGKVGAGTLFHMAGEFGWKRRLSGLTTPAASAGRATRPQERTKSPAPSQGIAAQVWQRLSPATAEHGYIVAKDGVPDGLRVVPEGDPLRISGLSMAGALAVPVVPLAGGDPVSIQFIAPPEMAAQWKALGKPGKLNLPGAKVGGAYIVSDDGSLTSGGTIFVVEGVGQAWACWKATGHPAVVAFGWSRVRTVAEELRKRDPDARLVLVPDAGKEVDAEKIAVELGAEVVTMPEGSPPNFDANDYAQAEGSDALGLLLSQASKVEPELRPATWSVVPIDDLDTAVLPPQAWVWDGYIPAGELTLLGAHGGTGKSTVTLMLAVAVAVGLPLFGVNTTPAPVVFFSAEDSADVVRRRVQIVMRSMGVNAGDLVGRLQVLDATSAPELAGPQWQGDGEAAGRTGFGLTATGADLRNFLADLPAPLLIVDNASDTMAGNENARPEVRAFVRHLVHMVRPRGGAVLLLAHVDKGTSRGERAGGSEAYSGSTAWHNSARSRLFMSRDKETGGLLLEHQKANLGPLRELLRLAWPADGLPTLEEPLSGVVQAAAANRHRQALLRLIHEFTQRGEFVSTATTSRTHAGKLLRPAHGFPAGLQDSRLFELLRAAERQGLIVRMQYRGTDRKQRERWQLTQQGAESAGITDFAATAATAATAVVTALPALGEASPGEPAATAATSPPGGTGGIERTHAGAKPATLQAAGVVP